MPITLLPGEKLTSVLIYTTDMLVMGDVVTKEAVRVSTWLRTAGIPQFILVHEAKVLQFGGSSPKQFGFDRLFLPSDQVIAFNLKPPAEEPLDYDPNEPNRQMRLASALVGTFRFDGSLRMSVQTELARFLDVAKETFISMYDVAITNPSIPNMGVMNTPFALLRMANTVFATQAES
jgi:hypothetical protein